MNKEEIVTVTDTYESTDENGKIIKIKEKVTVKRKIVPTLKENKKIMEDCFAYQEKIVPIENRLIRKVQICTALNELECTNKECRFYKTKEKYEKEQGILEKREVEYE